MACKKPSTASALKRSSNCIDVQYVAQFHKEYLGFSGVTIFQMLNHLRTWYKITNAQHLAIKIRFAALWS